MIAVIAALQEDLEASVVEAGELTELKKALAEKEAIIKEKIAVIASLEEDLEAKGAMMEELQMPDRPAHDAASSGDAFNPALCGHSEGLWELVAEELLANVRPAWSWGSTLYSFNFPHHKQLWKKVEQIARLVTLSVRTGKNKSGYRFLANHLAIRCDHCGRGLYYDLSEDEMDITEAEVVNQIDMEMCMFLNVPVDSKKSQCPEELKHAGVTLNGLCWPPPPPPLP